MEGLIERVKDILVSPKKTWEVVKTEETSSTEIIRNYLLYLAAIPVICSFIGRVIIGSPGAGRQPFFRGIIWLALSYVLFFVSAYISAFVINLLAPNFGAVKNELAAFKLVAYSSTAPLVAGVFYLIPALSALAIFGLYGVYLLYLGLPILMECPQDKAVPYTIASILAVIGVYIAFFAIVGLFICRSLP
jgi:hypothetical protein